MTTCNVEFLKSIMTWIENNPDIHNNEWFGYKIENTTTHCMASIALLLHDPTTEFNWIPTYDLRGDAFRTFELNTGEYIDKRAQKLLGLTDEQAHHLFFKCISIEELRHAVDHIIGTTSS